MGTQPRTPTRPWPLTNSTCLRSAISWSVTINLCSDSNGMALIHGNAACPVCHAEFDREGMECSFGRSALHFLGSVLLERLSIIRKQRNPPHEREYWFLACGLNVLFGLPCRRIAIAGDLMWSHRRPLQCASHSEDLRSLNLEYRPERNIQRRTQRPIGLSACGVLRSTLGESDIDEWTKVQLQPSDVDCYSLSRAVGTSAESVRAAREL